MDEVTYTISYETIFGVVSAWIGTRKIGYLKWINHGVAYPEFHGEIAEVAVAKDYRKNKVASTMLALARKEDSRVFHSPSRTPLGQVWALATRLEGERLPAWSPTEAFEVNL